MLVEQQGSWDFIAADDSNIVQITVGGWPSMKRRLLEFGAGHGTFRNVEKTYAGAFWY